MITNGPMNVTVCSGTKANISCGYTGVNPFSTRPNWRIIKRNNNGSVISNETVSGTDVRHNKIDYLKFIVVTSTVNNADGSYLSVGPVDDTYNNTSYQCIFTINDNIIESDTAGTIIIVIGTYVHHSTTSFISSYLIFASHLAMYMYVHIKFYCYSLYCLSSFLHHY